MRKALKQAYVQRAIIALLILLVCVTVFNFWYQSRIYTEVVIGDDIAKLAVLFKKINDDVGIIDFRFQQQNNIDYLNVISFEGSEVGTMIVHSPKNWKGPYLRDNPMVQGKYYQVVKTKQGYFIVPGNGVKLNDGKIIGKDIIFDQNSDIEKMMKDPEYLHFQGENLAAKIDVSKEKPRIPVDEFLVEN